ncbi:16S rRNA (cytosine967-C5)-methyltransferase [Scopulibacillus daqui]|uniref:16S rRNA (cytosine(967)-C(5))-methyltransferase n=1 Tax=Scopulibacillus daqui TaxID=1469162 RepID=A0ABS2PW76_9BACL|nr:16S rRNA (cytosine(967)-C(5))-methyltransferase RsmB [Scopulibacillus daqui]MBM7644309.1 16S rRNA (cytosine967-C5)-methyltransferase [Scopulibacillus daqui]
MAKSITNPRELALDILIKVEKNHAYSQLLLHDTIKRHPLNPKDTGLLTQLVYGVLQRKLTLDYYLHAYVDKKKKMAAWVKWLLYLSIYQKVYLDKIPDHAVVNEAVTIARRRGHKGIAGFVNGVLRQMMRKGFPDLSDIDSKSHRLSIKYSHPYWLIERWIQLYGEDEALAVCETNNQPAPVTLRVNQLKTNREMLIQTLADAGIEAHEGHVAPEAVSIASGPAADTKAFREGLFTIQDESSMLVAHALDVKPGMDVLDACAGPGGKTGHIAEKMANSGSIHALDLHAHKTKLIDQQAERLGIDIIHTKALDAREAARVFSEKSFDRILIDAPCSGFGVIRRKPEIKWEKTANDVEQIAKVQADILNAVAPLVKTGGKLVYSTCTIDQKENIDTVTRFLKDHADFEVDETLYKRMPAVVQKYGQWENRGMVQILPHQFETDGFFISCLKKV